MKNLIFFFLSVFILASCGNDDTMLTDNPFTKNYENVVFEDNYEDVDEQIFFKNNYGKL